MEKLPLIVLRQYKHARKSVTEDKIEIRWSFEFQQYDIYFCIKGKKYSKVYQEQELKQLVILLRNFKPNLIIKQELNDIHESKYVLEIGELSSLTLEWSGKPPEDWDVLDEIVEEINNL